MDDESRQQAQEWANGITSQVLDWTWRAFDMLRAGALGSVDLTQPLEQLERDLARHHFREINMLWAQETSGECAFTPHHEYPEHETRSTARAKPPAYDIAFVWNANPRIACPNTLWRRQGHGTGSEQGGRQHNWRFTGLPR